MRTLVHSSRRVAKARNGFAVLMCTTRICRGMVGRSVLKQTHATTLFAQIRRRFEREMSTKPEYACIERGLDIIDLAQGLGRHVRGHRKLPRAAGTQATCIG